MPQADYLRDQGMASQSGVHLMGFFANLAPILQAARAAGSRTTLLAHSMGNLALQAAVESWFLHGNGDDALFDQAILAAGDCRYDSFDLPALARLNGLTRLARRVSVYYSGVGPGPAAQLRGQSRRLAAGTGRPAPPRRHRPVPAGAVPHGGLLGRPLPGFGFLTSHQYYRQSPEVRADIAATMGG